MSYGRNFYDSDLSRISNLFGGIPGNPSSPLCVESKKLKSIARLPHRGASQPSAMSMLVGGSWKPRSPLNLESKKLKSFGSFLPTGRWPFGGKFSASNHYMIFKLFRDSFGSKIPAKLII